MEKISRKLTATDFPTMPTFIAISLEYTVLISYAVNATIFRVVELLVKKHSYNMHKHTCTHTIIQICWVNNWEFCINKFNNTQPADCVTGYDKHERALNILNTESIVRRQLIKCNLFCMRWFVTWYISIIVESWKWKHFDAAIQFNIGVCARIQWCFYFWWICPCK